MTEEDQIAVSDVTEGEEAPVEELKDGDWKQFFKGAMDASVNFQKSYLHKQWSQNYRAFAGKHVNGSKYDTPRYKTRSKLFRPKTRAAVRKNDATAASALFSTMDVVSITPDQAADRPQVMTARLIHELLNYRLDREGPMTGPSWFMTAIGARQDSQMAGTCVSKQYWQYEEKTKETIYDVTYEDELGLPVIDPETGDSVTEEEIVKETVTVKDRLMIDNVPPEHAHLDPSADWRNPIQEGGFFICDVPMRKNDVQHMIDKPTSRPITGGARWRSDIDVDALVTRGGSSRMDTQSTRRAREDGADRYESRHTDSNGEIVWLHEVFYRYDGEDWCWWMLGENTLLSDPVPVEDAYPALKGLRPYVCGFGALETHKVHPTAPVTTWQPLQQETNDITNLRLDAQKMSISPITKVRRGRNVDLKQVQNRGPDATLMVQDADDVTFDRAPNPPSTTQLDLNNLTTELDELAGVFSGSSIQANRQLNETVGGMRMLAGASNSITEFDLRVFVETWAEPCLRQCAMLIQYHETSERALAIAGEKAGLLFNMGQPKQDQPNPMASDARQDMQQGLQPISLVEAMGMMEELPLQVRVNVGIGAMDTREKMEKFHGALKMTLEMMPLLIEDGITVNARELAQEGWGLFGYKDITRFFKVAPPKKDNPPESAQLEMLKQKGRMAEKKAEGDNKLAIEEMRSRLKQVEIMLNNQQAQADAAMERQHFEMEHRLDQAELDFNKRKAGVDAVLNGLSRIPAGQPRAA